MHRLPNSGSYHGLSSTASCSDMDQPYMFGRRPTPMPPFPFTPRQFGRLLVLRGRVQDELVPAGDR
jgi:hypothetical protein